MEKILKVAIVFGLVTMEANGETLVRKHQGSLNVATDGMDQHATQQKSIEVDASGNVESSDHSVDSKGQLSPSMVRKTMEIDAVGNVEILDHSPSLVRKSMKGDAVGEVQKSMEGDAAAKFQKYGPYPLQRNVLDYFKQWSNGNIAQKLKTSKRSDDGAQAWLEKATHEQFRSASGLLGLLRTTSERTCLKSSRTFVGDAKLYRSTGDPDDVFHALLVLPDGALQYAAVFRGTVMAAEPALCQIEKKDEDLDDGDGTGDVTAPAEKDMAEKEAGASHMLDIESDATVSDCSDLFARTVQQQCGTSFEFDVISASEHVIDGIEVEMTLKVTEGTSEFFHTVSCDFEVPEDGQTTQTVNQTQVLPEEEEGLVATLQFQGSVCEANQRSTSSETDSLKLMQNYSFGEISHYKGNEWMLTWLPLDRISLESSTPSSYDIRRSKSMCFPGTGYSGVVRNQGNCGSCWAFAAATAAMTTLCAKNSGQKETGGNPRYEISTQQIMSCNSHKRGCNGGWHSSADSAWRSKGLFKDRDFRYLCGGGSALNHFDSGTSCKSWPWGKNCPSSGAFRYWSYGGMRSTRGESAMKQLISQNNGLYVTFAVHRNFFSYRSGVYTSLSGGLAGYHAVVALGYGNDRGTNFWTLQNSWGSSWGSRGYFNMKRGSNLAGIEDLAVYVTISSSAPTRRRRDRRRRDRRRRDRRRRDRRRRDRRRRRRSCFPSAAKVYAKDYGHVSIDSLQQGSLILSADASGRTFYDEVSFYSLADPKRKSEAFLAVGTSSNRAIRITGAHHLPVGSTCCGNLKMAKDLRVGDFIWTVAPGDQAATLDTVKSIATVVDDGLHSPVMLNGGHPIVDGVVTSFDDIDSINMATRWMPFLTKFCTAANMCGTTATMIKKYECFAKGECGHREIIEAAKRGALVTRQASNNKLIV